MTPVALFTYRRPDLLVGLLHDLMTNPEMVHTPLYVFSDAPRCGRDANAVGCVRDLCRGIQANAGLHLISRPLNMGCAANVIAGVSEVLAEHDSVIVIEDDLRLSPHFLSYMNAALTTYRERSDIYSISGFSPTPELLGMPVDYQQDVYLSRRNASWGWATWKDRWQQVDWMVSDHDGFRGDRERRRAFDRGGNDLSLMLDAQMAGRIDSWAIRFSYAHFVHGAYSVCPRWSYTDHAGDDGSGTHVPMGGGYRVDISQAMPNPHLPPDLRPDPRVLQALQRHYGEHWLSALLGGVPGVRGLTKVLKARLGITGRLL